MRFESILQIILLGSSIGLGGIILKKIPLVRTLPEESSQSSEKKQDFVLKLKTKVKKNNPFKDFSYEVFLEKILASVRTISSNMENKTSGLMKELKQSVKERKARENDNYWEKIEKSTRNKRNSKSKNTDNLL